MGLRKRLPARAGRGLLHGPVIGAQAMAGAGAERRRPHFPLRAGLYISEGQPCTSMGILRCLKSA